MSEANNPTSEASLAKFGAKRQFLASIPKKGFCSQNRLQERLTPRNLHGWVLTSKVTFEYQTIFRDICRLRYLTNNSKILVRSSNCQTPVLGLGLGVDFSFANNNNNNKNKKNNSSPKSIKRGCTTRLKFDA